MSSRTANESILVDCEITELLRARQLKFHTEEKINTVQDILGGLRSACTYSGARRLKIYANAHFYSNDVQENKVYS